MYLAFLFFFFKTLHAIQTCMTKANPEVNINAVGLGFLIMHDVTASVGSAILSESRWVPKEK